MKDLGPEDPISFTSRERAAAKSEVITVAELLVTFTRGECSGPLQKYLRDTGVLDTAAGSLKAFARDSRLFASLPYTNVFVTIRYGCANFKGDRTVATTTVPSKEWKFDKRQNEYLAVVSLDGGSWEQHDKVARKRAYLEPKDIECEVEAVALAAAQWIARAHALDESEVRMRIAELPRRPKELTTPDDLQPPETQRLLVFASVAGAKAREKAFDLEIVFPIDGFGTQADAKRKEQISKLLRGELERAGVGRWTGDSMGSGTFEIGFSVRDLERAKVTIREILREHGLDAGMKFEEL